MKLSIALAALMISGFLPKRPGPSCTANTLSIPPVAS